ncbi:xanthine dehydrogenase family protein molybdopterin-binding subunit [Rhizobium leguminosarum]|uniref:xanthine dehydrogenase family protein molybdopterin-binding subunit n=1 Tax=Rhizobium leguminosarum TaxID=384 RepID=UPI001C93CFDA|nr:molybdopterin cofactor-binding domain-containing protein [Rhizobium leguminosarum]MBY5396668.1 xanthine dehydrogenase family protein molybdopterin-binding subunit [Rhizobium leguminosarum]
MTKTSLPRAVALSRRSFLVTVGGTAVTVAFANLSSVALGAATAQAATGDFTPNVWVTIASDGIVSIISPASEMGQGVMTSIPLLIAEDMDADWDMVRIVQAPADAEKYGNPNFGGAQLTAGSDTTRGYYLPLRLVGAQTRKILLAIAASRLNVPVSELTTEPSRVVHLPSGRSLGYGEIAATGELPDVLPQVSEAELKPIDQCRYIGRMDVNRIDVPSKVNGTAKFGIDVELPDMLYGAVLRSPVPGEAPESIDDAAARAVKGVIQVVSLRNGVGIIGESYDAARRAKEVLNVTWTNSSSVRRYNSTRLVEAYRDVGRDLAQAGVISHTQGDDAAAAIAGAARVIAADYLSDHVHHVTMEPMNATALVSSDSVEVWAPTQGPGTARDVAARIGGTTPDKVKVNTTLLGGGFGRRAEQDFVIEAVLLAKAVQGRPVKVIWSREDDVRHGKYRPLAAQHVEVGLDASGNIVGWHHRLVADSILARISKDRFQRAGGQDSLVTDGTIHNYRVPAHLVQFVRQDNGQDVGSWRAVGNGYTKFAIECVIDEVAAAKGVDPVAFRLELLSEQPRARKVIEAVAAMAEWNRPRNGRALGIAYSDAFEAHCAEVAEVSLDGESGEIRVHNVWCAIDPGVAIQPLNIEAQVAGAIVHGASHALYEQLNIVDGEVQESNLDTYRVMRMSEIPQIHVRIMPTPENRPAGIGEAGLPPVGPAIANAVARLTGGVRLRHYPFLPERVKAALSS